MKNVNKKKNNILSSNLYKIFNIFLTYTDDENDILILKIHICSPYLVKLYFFSKKKYNLEKFYYHNNKIFLKILNKKLSIKLPKFIFINISDKKFDIIMKRNEFISTILIDNKDNI